jgi:hypothetical protein
MSTEIKYGEFILESIIKEILYSGQSPTIESIDSAYNAFVADKDLTQPLFNNALANVVQEENVSAAKINNTNFEIWRDLKIAYDTMFDTTNKSIVAFDRWRSESLALEAKLKSLDTRITDLAKTQLHLGTHYISEVFSDTSQVDLTKTTAYVNLKDNNVSMNASDNKNPNRINLNYIKPEDITFTVLSRAFLQNVVTAPGAELINAFDDMNNFWQSRVFISSAQQPVTAELKFKISDTTIFISKINCMLHTANTNSSMQITPLISNDGINFKQLDVSNITQSITDNGSWSFPSIEATHIKLIMTKAGFDFNDNQSYIYEFGMQEIAVYNLSFDPDMLQTLISTALFVPDINKNPIPYYSVSLDTCDDVPSNTDIKYYVAALTNTDDFESWTSIDPINKENAIYPTQINFGQKKDFELANVGISFNANRSAGFVNPAADYLLVTLFENTSLTITPKTSTVTKYILFNSNDRLLTHEIDGAASVQKQNIRILRNVGFRGDNILVRGIQRGWTYEEPYYASAIGVQNPNGISINFGDKDIILDGATKNGIVKLTTGTHNIKIRKENWITIAAGITDLVALKTADPLFPYNQKLLVEGYSLDDPQNPYTGVDVFAGYFMTQVPIVDFIHNIDAADYSKFAVDTDAVDTNKATPSLVFVVKSNENVSDFLDELFTIRFTVESQTYNYIKFKAILSTLDTGISPYLVSYKLKLSN